MIFCGKTANDIRRPASGPRCGLGELSLPENAGKGQPDSMRSHDNGRGAGSWQQRGCQLRRLARNFELNVFKPVII
jgi:fumarate hydratase class II